jgi:hypothetical protein
MISPHNLVSFRHWRTPSYETQDGGRLLSAFQMPVARAGDGNIDSDEFVIYAVSPQKDSFW